MLHLRKNSGGRGATVRKDGRTWVSRLAGHFQSLAIGWPSGVDQCSFPKREGGRLTKFRTMERIQFEQEQASAAAWSERWWDWLTVLTDAP